MTNHEYTDQNIAAGLPADFMCGCAKGELLGPCEQFANHSIVEAGPTNCTCWATSRNGCPQHYVR